MGWRFKTWYFSYILKIGIKAVDLASFESLAVGLVWVGNSVTFCNISRILDKDVQ